MRIRGFFGFLAAEWLVAIVVALLLPATASCADSEMTFDVLDAGTRTYTNVTVTTRTKSYVFLIHKDGMVNIKTSELPQETQVKLGLAAPAKPRTNNVAVTLAKATLEKIDSPQVQKLQETLAINPGTGMPKIPKIEPWMIYALLGGCVVLFLAYCYCCMLICQKTGNEPGVLVWIPFLQFIPLFRAAGMSPLWILACLVPVLNFVAQVLWSFKIARARGKSAWVGMMLILPVTNIIAFLYLAFSSGAAKEKEKEKAERRPQLMTLEAA